MNLFMCREDHYDDACHQENLSQLQKDWDGNQAGLPHARMAFKPNFWRAPAAGHGPSSLWDTATEDQNTKQLRADVDADAKQYKKSYEDDVQNIFPVCNTTGMLRKTEPAFQERTATRRACLGRRERRRRGTATRKFASRISRRPIS